MQCLLELKLDWFHYCQGAISVLIDNNIKDKYFHKSNVIQPKVFEDFFLEANIQQKVFEDSNRVESLDYSMDINEFGKSDVLNLKQLLRKKLDITGFFKILEGFTIKKKVQSITLLDFLT